MRKRAINFNLDHYSFFFDFGTYALMIYYAEQIDHSEAINLLDLTTSEHFYRAEYDLLNDKLTDDDDEAHFDRKSIQDVVAFIDSQVIPSLKQEEYNLIDKYKGRENFYHLFNNAPDLSNRLGINEDDYYMDHRLSVPYHFIRLRDLFQYSLSVNQPFKVYTW
jgi:hypothetical protein